MAESTEATSSGPTHIPALDGVRGIAILLVLVNHFLLAGLQDPDHPVPAFLLAQGHVPSIWIDRTVARIASTGWAGVDLFFVLSGFLITRILLGAREGKSYFRNFYARRVLRIFPVYYGFLFFLIVILPYLPGFRGDPDLTKLRDHQLEYWTYLFNVTISLHPLVDRGIFINGHFWSLMVEEQFYLVWPLVVFLLGRRGLGVFCALCIIAAPIIRYGLLHGVVPQMHNGFAAYMLMPARMDSLAIGGLIAVASGEPHLLRRGARWALPVGGAAVLFLAILYLARGGLWIFDDRVEVFGFSAMTLTFAAFLTMVMGGPPGALQAACGHRVLTFFGRYSYALYVVHVQIIQQLVQHINDRGGLPVVWRSNLPAAIGFAILGIAVSVAVAWLSWHLYEQQFLKLKRFVPYGRAQPRLLAHSSAT